MSNIQILLKNYILIKDAECIANKCLMHIDDYLEDLEMEGLG